MCEGTVERKGKKGQLGPSRGVAYLDPRTRGRLDGAAVAPRLTSLRAHPRRAPRPGPAYDRGPGGGLARRPARQRTCSARSHITKQRSPSHDPPSALPSFQVFPDRPRSISITKAGPVTLASSITKRAVQLSTLAALLAALYFGFITSRQPQPSQPSTSPSPPAAAHMSAPVVSEAVKSALKIVPRRSGARGHADHGWLKTYHTFVSFPALEGSVAARPPNGWRTGLCDGHLC